MRIRQRTLALLAAAVFVGGASLARADEAAALTGEIQTMDTSAATKGSGAVTGKIASDFQTFAGSKQNSTALVTGLRSGSEITLTEKGEPSATFTPATKPMGYGNVSTSLALAKYQLGQQGITNPTPEQLKTALDGGTITFGGKTVEYQGVLQMRADGMGWGQIAQQLGTKLGPVVSGIKSQNAHIATLPAAKHATVSTAAGVTTATGAAASAASSSPGSRGSASGKGIVTASGASTPGAAKGKEATTVTTAGGGASAPRGQGIVTAAGQGGSPAAQGAGGGKGGVVSASGAAAGTAAGGGASNGKAVGHTK
jgi:antitoxin (DNA-binding transcriptional repressor) of toxin-antitoxin stability system